MARGDFQEPLDLLVVGLVLGTGRIVRAQPAQVERGAKVLADAPRPPRRGSRTRCRSTTRSTAAIGPPESASGGLRAQ
jgi:hypothetical protein